MDRRDGARAARRRQPLRGGARGAPRQLHQLVLGRLHVRLFQYLEALGTGHVVLFSPADISWGEDTLVQPDLFVFPRSEFSGQWGDIRTLLLAVEVLSPSTRRRDRGLKRRLYQEYRVATYWIVDPEARAVEVWHPGDEAPERVADVLRWQMAPEAPVLEIPLAELFAELPPE